MLANIKYCYTKGYKIMFICFLLEEALILVFIVCGLNLLEEAILSPPRM